MSLTARPFGIWKRMVTLARFYQNNFFVWLCEGLWPSASLRFTRRRRSCSNLTMRAANSLFFFLSFSISRCFSSSSFLFSSFWVKPNLNWVNGNLFIKSEMRRKTFLAASSLANSKLCHSSMILLIIGLNSRSFLALSLSSFRRFFFHF